MWIPASCALLLLLAGQQAVAQPAALPPCPATPNCVSSQASGSHHIAPLDAGPDATTSLATLQSVLKELPRVTWQRVGSHSLHAEFRSRLFGFVDDVDVVARPDGRLDIRSASRSGYWDLGANRRRVEMLRKRVAQEAH